MALQAHAGVFVLYLFQCVISFALHNIAANRNLNIRSLRLSKHQSGVVKLSGCPKFRESHPEKLFLASRGARSDHVHVSKSYKRE